MYLSKRKEIHELPVRLYILKVKQEAKGKNNKQNELGYISIKS